MSGSLIFILSDNIVIEHIFLNVLYFVSPKYKTTKSLSFWVKHDVEIDKWVHFEYFKS